MGQLKRSGKRHRHTTTADRHSRQSRGQAHQGVEDLHCHLVGRELEKCVGKGPARMAAAHDCDKSRRGDVTTSYT